MSLVSKIISKTTLPLYWRHLGEAGQLGYLDEFARLEKLSSFRLSKIQRSGLRQILSHAYGNSPYYKKVFDDIGATPIDIRSLEDLARFPILTKPLMRQNMNLILAENYPPGRRAMAATGGSTGIPLVFWRDYKCRDMKQAMHLNFKRWCGYELGDRQLFFWGAQQDYDQKRSLKSRLIRNFATRCWFVNTDDLLEANLEKSVRQFRRLNPKLTMAYPNIIYAFAQRLAQRRIDLRFKTIVCSAEQMFDYQREFLKLVFEAEVFEKYGSREIGTIACECRAHQGMHYFAPGVILESVDSNNKPVGTGLGNLLVTDLWNYAMPLIRYQVGDLVRFDHTRCACGLELPRIAEIAGRVVDAIVKPNGEMIAGQALIAIIRLSEIEAQAQIVQKTPERFEIHYVSERELPEHNVRFISSSFADIFGKSVRVDFIRETSLERDKSGKFRYVRSEMKSPFEV